MKKLALAICFSILSSLGAMAQMAIENNVITVEVSEDSSRNDLLEIRQQLSEHGLDFRYNKVNWIEGQLKSIHLDVLSNDGRSKSFTAMNLAGTGTIKLVYRVGDSTENSFCLGFDCE